MSNHALEGFHPLIRQWFIDKYGEPSPIQKASWPRISAGESLVATAPTGSGKTLTAFLALIDRLFTEPSEGDHPRILYVSPLKALNRDIQKNLLEPLEEIEEIFEKSGESCPKITVLTRSGDTTQSERQKMLRNPPSIMVTTPESLLFMITAARSRRLFTHIECVVLDEIHAMIENRRGCTLMACLERVVDLAGEFQRVALSATVNPPCLVSQYLGGFDATGLPRKVQLVEDYSKKELNLEIRLPEKALTAIDEGLPIWDHLIEEFYQVIQSNRSTLFFVVSRRTAERITHDINQLAGEIVAYSHHGSLAREIREEVEHRLKEGELRAIVATSSLEMGIDIGELDEVVLVQSPMSVSSTLQRIGRSGHGVGRVSRAKLYPTHANDNVLAAALAGAVATRDLEPLRPMLAPLDLLAQLVVSFTVAGACHLDHIFSTLTRSYPYATLERSDFDKVIDMLTGGFEDRRIRSLRPRIAHHQDTGMIEMRKGAQLALYASGGTIPDRGYYKVRNADSNSLVGELDEEFVWEAKIGQKLTLGAQQWTIESIDHNDVKVRPTRSNISSAPFYLSETQSQDFHLSMLVRDFLQTADELLESDEQEELERQLIEIGFDASSTTNCVSLLNRQRESTGSLPHTSLVIAEHLLAGPGGYLSASSEDQLVIHTLWGSRVNRPIALAMESSWRDRFKSPPDIRSDNQTITCQLTQETKPDEVLSFLNLDSFHNRLTHSLQNSPFFGVHFRECAGRALLLEKSRFNHRVPLWMNRMLAKKLLAAIHDCENFPVLIEAWRTCLNHEFDLGAVEQVLNGINNGTIRISVVRRQFPSPFATQTTFDQINRYMYDDDTPQHSKQINLPEGLVSTVARHAKLRPELSKQVIQGFESKVQRTIAGYEPDGNLEVSEWVRERVWIPEEQWWKSVKVPAKIKHIQSGSWSGFIHPQSQKLVKVNPKAAVENALQYYGPRTLNEIASLIPLSTVQIHAIVEKLTDRDVLTRDVRVEDSDEEMYCDRSNLVGLLRFQRRSQQQHLDPLPKKSLTQFLSAWYDANSYGSGIEAVTQTLERLRGFDAPVKFWMKELWRPTHKEIPLKDLEELFTNQEFAWRGTGRQRMTVITDEDELPFKPKPNSTLDHCFKDPDGRYTYIQLRDLDGSSPRKFNELFWKAVWKGEVSTDSFRALYKAEDHHYKLDHPLGEMYPPPDIQSVRSWKYKRTLKWPGNWSLSHPSNEKHDVLTELEIEKSRARVVLERRGIVSRELTQREGNNYRWRNIFRALRLMELAGEVVSGLFLEDLSGPQFALPESLELMRNLPKTGAQWISSYDPRCPCGLGLGWEELPVRRIGNFLGLYDGVPICWTSSNGWKLKVFVKPDDPRLNKLFKTIKVVDTRDNFLTISQINGEEARFSPYFPKLKKYAGAYTDYSTMISIGTGSDLDEE